MSREELYGRLARGAADLGLELEESALEALIRYIDLLARWNRTYNLTAVRNPAMMVVRHLLDCLAISPYVRGPRLLDIGTGPGLPGLVLAVARPELDCVLLDGNGKKVRFCRQAVAELELENVDVVQERLEHYRPEERFETITARAFGDLEGLVPAAQRLAAPAGHLLAMKGVYPSTELSQVAPVARCVTVVPLSVPGLDAERHLVDLDMACLADLPAGAEPRA